MRPCCLIAVFFSSSVRTRLCFCSRDDIIKTNFQLSSYSALQSHCIFHVATLNVFEDWTYFVASLIPPSSFVKWMCCCQTEIVFLLHAVFWRWAVFLICPACIPLDSKCVLYSCLHAFFNTVNVFFLSLCIHLDIHLSALHALLWIKLIVIFSQRSRKKR